jgi:hypothetical protein
MKAVNLHLDRTGNQERQKALFSGAAAAHQHFGGMNFEGFNWALYEPVAKDLFIQIVRENPVEAVKVYALKMPVVFASTLAYLAGFEEFAKPSLINGNRTHPRFRAERDLRLGFRLAAIFALLACVLLAPRIPPRIPALLLAMFGFSLVPSMLVAPTYQYVQVSVLLGVAALFSCAAFLVGRGLARAGLAVSGNPTYA